MIIFHSRKHLLMIFIQEERLEMHYRAFSLLMRRSHRRLLLMESLCLFLMRRLLKLQEVLTLLGVRPCIIRPWWLIYIVHKLDAPHLIFLLNCAEIVAGHRCFQLLRLLYLMNLLFLILDLVLKLCDI